MSNLKVVVISLSKELSEKIKFTADIFADSHDQVRAALLFRKQGKRKIVILFYFSLKYKDA